MFAADSKSLVVRSKDASIHVWDVATGKVRKKFSGPPVLSLGRSASRLRPTHFPGLALSADGKLLAVYHFSSTIRLWDLDTGKEAQAYGGHQESVTSVAFSTDGKRLATASQEGILVWDRATGKEMRRVEGVGHFSNRSKVALAPDGLTMIQATELGCRRWNTSTGKELGHWQMDAGQLALSPDAKVLAAAARTTLVLRDTTTGKELHKIEMPNGKGIRCLAFTPDGQRVAVARDGGASNAEVHVFETSSGKPVVKLASPPNDFVLDLAFSPDGRVLATASSAGGFVLGPANSLYGSEICIWEVTTGNKRKQWKVESVVYRLAFTPDGQTLASSAADGAISLWQVMTSKELTRLRGHQGSILDLAFAPDGKVLASASSDTTVLLWDTGKHRPAVTPVVNLTPEKLQALWDDLGNMDAAKAYAALAALQAAPGQTVALLQRQLPPASIKVDPEKITRLIGDLDSNSFMVREKARQELEKYGELAEPQLRKALEDKPSLEMQQRVQQLLDRALGSSPERLQDIRGIEALEHIGTAEARQVLESLARGTAGALRTRQAEGALRRLGAAARSN